MSRNKGVHVYRPKEAESVRHVETTKKDRQKHAKEFRAQKEHERKEKEKRFARIAEERKKRKDGGSGSGGGINIEVTSD
jgi:hypothetical protein